MGIEKQNNSIESVEKMQGALHLNRVINRVIPNIIPRIEQPFSSAAEHKAFLKQTIENTGGPDDPGECYIVESELIDSGVVIFDGDIDNYIQGTDGKVWYVGCLAPWRVSNEPTLKIEPCFNEEILRAKANAISVEADKIACLQDIDALVTLFATERVRLGLNQEVVLPDCESMVVELQKSIDEFVQKVENSPIPEVLEEYVSLKEDLMRSVTPIVALFKKIKKETNIEKGRCKTLEDVVYSLLNKVRAKYPERN